MINKTSQRILKLLLKDFSVKHSVSSIAKETGITRVGTWKALKKLQDDKFIILSSIGKGKTSTYIVNLNFVNLLLEKNLTLSLTEDSFKNKRWLDNFSELEKEIDFLIIFGSILKNPRDANDIDILIIAKKDKFTKIDNQILKIQKTQIKKIHTTNLTKEEFKEELVKKNKIFIDAIKNGIVLFGQEQFIKFMKELK